MRAREGRAVDLLPTVLLYRIQLQNLPGMKQFQILSCLLAWQLASLIEQSSARITGIGSLTQGTLQRVCCCLAVLLRVVLVG